MLEMQESDVVFHMCFILLSELRITDFLFLASQKFVLLSLLHSKGLRVRLFFLAIWFTSKLSRYRLAILIKNVPTPAESRWEIC